MTTHLRFNRSLAVVALALGGSLLTAPPVNAQHEHAHEHDAHAAAGLTLDNGARWATDEPLRIGMQRIRDAAAPAMVLEQDPHADGGLPRIEQALRQYPEYFDHPGWEAPASGE